MKQLKISFKDGKPKEVYEEVEDFEIEIPKEYQIEELKQNLADTDYKAIRDGERAIMKMLETLSANGVDIDKSHLENYQQRENWRDEINRLESEG